MQKEHNCKAEAIILLFLMVAQIKNSTENYTVTKRCSFSLKLHTGKLQLH